MTLEPARARRIARFSLFAALMLAAFGVRVVTSAMSELRAGDEYRKNKQLEAAVVHYRRAARWYAPGSPFHVTALAHLGAIGADAERRGDTELALSSYRAIRAAIMSTRSFYIPEGARLEAADERIASLMAAMPAPPMDAGKSPDKLRSEHLALLRAPHGPSTFWSLVLLVGFVAWVSGAFAFSQRAIDDDDRFIRGEVLRWGALIAVGFGLFALGLSLA